MDKWKDIELEKMKAGGNAKFREFLEAQDDYEPSWSLQDKYSSRAAALFRDKVRACLAGFTQRRAQSTYPDGPDGTPVPGWFHIER